jgi:hypothetical protein
MHLKYRENADFVGAEGDPARGRIKPAFTSP